MYALQIPKPIICKSIEAFELETIFFLTFNFNTLRILKIDNFQKKVAGTKIAINIV